jgi:hypothetical protein
MVESAHPISSPQLGMGARIFLDACVYLYGECVCMFVSICVSAFFGKSEQLTKC